ncbi:MAG: hypothetical protein BVN33_02420 [Proteobacteria bacterium ST_bin13]|nr:MAG: hypothetical protein BVN33_02420 [Proteobacteria bacterium ST_bin13]
MTNPIEMAEAASNALTGQRKIIDSINQFFAEGCVFIEPDGSSRSTKKDQFANLNRSESTALHGQAVGDNFSVSARTPKMTADNGSPIVGNETFERNWRDGKILS